MATQTATQTETTTTATKTATPKAKAKRNSQAKSHYSTTDLELPTLQSDGTFQVGKRAATLRGIMILAAQVQQSVDNNLSTISNALLKIAGKYQDAKDIVAPENYRNERNRAASEAFMDACKLEEAYIRSAEAGQWQRDTLPRCWTQAKSNIKAALEFGINLDLYKSESALRKQVIKIRGLTSKNPVDDEMKEFKKLLGNLPQEQALSILEQAQAVCKAVIEELIPAVPEKKEEAPKKEEEVTTRHHIDPVVERVTKRFAMQ